MQQAIREGFAVFVSGRAAAVGSVRRVAPGGRAELVIQAGSAGEFGLPLAAVESVHADRVVLADARITPELRAALAKMPAAEEDAEESGLDAAFIERQHRRLLELRQRLLGEEGNGTASARELQEQYGAEAQEFEERAQDMAQNEIRQARHDVDRQRLAQIERALRKIEEGSYGLSDASGQRIPRARLEITPEAFLTVEEEQRRERRFPPEWPQR